MKIGDKVLVPGTFDGYDQDGNALISFIALSSDSRGDMVEYHPQVEVKPDYVITLGPDGSLFGSVGDEDESFS